MDYGAIMIRWRKLIMRFSFFRYLKEKYSFSRDIAADTLRDTGVWKGMPRVSKLEGAQRARVAKIKHRMVTKKVVSGILRHGLVQIMQIDVIVTTFCTLNCKNCSVWVPYLKDHKTFSFETLRQNLDTLFNKVDYIQRINIIGGEAMLHPKLPMIIQHILHYRDKIGYILIITNGTIIPTEELLSVFRDGGDFVRVLIDSYPPKLSSGNAEAVRKAFRECGINADINKDLQWYDIGTFGKCYSHNELIRKETFDSCLFRHCTALYDGKLYRCSRSWGVELNTREAEEENAVIDLKDIRSKFEMYRRLIQFYGIIDLKACSYCKRDCMKRPVKVGEQI